MSPRQIIFALIILALLPGILVDSSRAQPIQITVGQSSIIMNMHLALQENLTSLPSINTYFVESNSSTIRALFTNAISKLVPSAHVVNLEMRATTSNSSGMWRLEEDYSVTVVGASTNLGGTTRARVDFVAMNLSQSMNVSNQELNAVGSAYFLTPLNSQDSKTTVFYIDGHQTLSSFIPAQTTSTFWLLDLTWVPPISSWPERQDLLRQTTEWSLDLGSPRYNLTLGRCATSIIQGRCPTLPLISMSMASYYPTFNVTVPANAWVDGNTISFNVPTPFETVMPFLATASVAALIVVSLWDRRLTGSLRTGKKKR